MAKTQKRYRTEAAFNALRLGHAPGSFDEFLDKLKKAERKEDAALHEAASKRAKHARKKQLRAIKEKAAAMRKAKRRAEWNAKRDKMHLAFLEQGIDPIGVGGVVTDRDVARVSHVYGENAGQRLRSFGEGHRRGYVLTMGDLVMVRIQPGEMVGGVALADRCGEFGKMPLRGTFARLVDAGYLHKRGTGRRSHPTKAYQEGVVFGLTSDGCARRAWLIDRLQELGEPVERVLQGFRG